MVKKELFKAQLETRPVAWAGNSPTKYQSSLSYQVTEKRTIRILGDPMSTEEKAIEALCKELVLWEQAMAAFKNVKL